MSSNFSFNAPFFFKNHFYDSTKKNPNANVVQGKNAAHVQYIGLRSGVVVQDSVLEKELNIEVDSAAGHLTYAHERPKSHGLFSQNEDEVIDIKGLQKELLEHEGIVWRQILSLREDDAQRLNLTERDQWEKLLRATVIDAGNKMDIRPTNLRWVAAFHQEEGHPHVHLMLWEKNPKRTRGALSKGEVKDIKRVYVNEIFGKERASLYQEKTITRDLLRDLSKRTLSDATKTLRELNKSEVDVFAQIEAINNNKRNKIPPKFHDEQSKELLVRIKQIERVLPGEGKMNYQYMPEITKEKLRVTARWLLNQPQFKELKEGHENAVRELTKQYTLDENQIKMAINKASDDLNKRISQVLLKAAVESTRFNLYSVNQKYIKKVTKKLTNLNTKIELSYNKDIAKKASQLLDSFGVDFSRKSLFLKELNNKCELELNEDDLMKFLNPTVPQEIKQMDKENLEQIIKLFELVGSKELTEDVKKQFSVDDELIKKVKKEIVNESKVFITESQWNKFNEILGTKNEYPWRTKESSEVIEEFSDLEKVKAQLSNASFTVEDREANWTAYTLNVALKEMKIHPQDRHSIINEIARESSVNLDSGVFNADSEETKTLKSATWDKVCKNIGLNIKYPFITKYEMEYKHEILESSVENLKSITLQKQLNESDLKEVTQTLGKISYNFGITKDERSEVLNFLMQKFNPAELETNEMLNEAGKGVNLINIIGKTLGARDPMNKVLSDYSVVLFSCGLGKEQIKDEIIKWNQNAKLRLNEENVERIISSVEKKYLESQLWGREMFISKNDYKQLSDHLKVNISYLWKPEGHSNMNVLKNVMKGVWREVEREQMQQEAKASYIRKRTAEVEQRRKINPRAREEEIER